MQRFDAEVGMQRFDVELCPPPAVLLLLACLDFNSRAFLSSLSFSLALIHASRVRRRLGAYSLTLSCAPS
ncbi:hypothetical protein K1719_037759 [Acacia pycnantha]|nr:hypothetical protein K1719_037759 [Acacia pycnantha]